MHYDVIVIGAGPSGLMTALTAKQNGLSVLIVELKKAIAENLRLCAAVLYIKPGFHGETEYLEEDRIVFVENDFAVRYDGGYQPLHEWCYVSPGGRRLRMGKKNFPVAVVLNKPSLIQGLLEDAEAEGVTVWNETAALKVENTDRGVKVLMRRQRGEEEWVEAKKCVVSDGICSRTTRVSFPEVWNKRTHLATGTGFGYLAENVDCAWGENVWPLCKNEFGSAYFLPTPMRSPSGNTVWKVFGFSTDPKEKQEKAEKSLHFLTHEEPLARFFSNMNILGREGFVLDFYTPIYEPAIGHTLLVGDVCAMQEVDIQGALACGFRAGHAVADELNDKDGFKEYTTWWNGAFEFNRSEDPTSHLARGFGVWALGAEVLDYWFSLCEHEVMNYFIDHNNLGAILEAGFRRCQETIEKERPEIAQVLRDYFSVSPQEAYRGYQQVKQ